MPKKNASPKSRLLNAKKCIPPKTLPNATNGSFKYSSMSQALLLDRYSSNSDRYSSNSDHYQSNNDRVNSKKVFDRNFDRCNSSNSERYNLNTGRYSFSNSERYFLNDNTTDEDDLDATPVQRNAANARERARMRVLSKAFFRLKTTLPWVPKDTKLSKLDTLRLASGYILHLKLLLSQDSHEAACPKILNVNWPFGFQSQDCMDQTLICVQDMKIDASRKS